MFQNLTHRTAITPLDITPARETTPRWSMRKKKENVPCHLGFLRCHPNTGNPSRDKKRKRPNNFHPRWFLTPNTVWRRGGGRTAGERGGGGGNRVAKHRNEHTKRAGEAPAVLYYKTISCRARVPPHLHHGGVLDRVSVRDDASPVDHKPRARRLLLLQPLPRQ